MEERQIGDTVQGDRLAQAWRVYFYPAECLFPMARGFFRWPSISSEVFCYYFYCNITAACPIYNIYTWEWVKPYLI